MQQEQERTDVPLGTSGVLRKQFKSQTDVLCGFREQSQSCG